MRKIYNEIIIDMNPESPSFEKVLHEDSFLYDGPMALANKAVCSANSEDTNYACCEHSPWLQMEDASGTVLTLEVPNNSNWFNDIDGDGWYYDDASQWSDSPFCDDGYTMIRLKHDCGDNGGDDNCSDTGLTNCCVPNTVKKVTFANDAPGAGNAWYGRNPFCLISQLGEASGCVMATEYGFISCHGDENPGGGGNCKVPTLTEPWNLTFVDLGSNSFEYSSYDETWLCNLARAGSTIHGCNGYTYDGGYADYALQCSCPQEDCDENENNQYTGTDPISGCVPYGTDNPFGSACNLQDTDNSGYPWRSFCDTTTMESGPGIYEDITCGYDGQQYCSCGMLNECGVCQSPLDENDDPGCGSLADACGEFGGAAGSAVITDFVNASGQHNIIRYRMIDGYDQYFNSGAWNDGDGQNTGPHQWGYNGPGTEDWNPCQTGLFDDDGDGPGVASTYDNFCYCNCGGSDPLPFPIYCYATADGANDDPITFWACENEDCTDFGIGWSGDYEASFDQGCRNEHACNYSNGYEKDCGGQPHVFESAPGANDWLDDGEVGNDECCVYPANYCVADGSIYSYYNSTGWIADAAGVNDLCDVAPLNEPWGTPQITTACPMCDCGSNNYDCLDECGTAVEGYAWNPTAPAKMTSNFLKGTPDCAAGNYCNIYAGIAIDVDTGASISVPVTMYDTCDGNCGLDGTEPATGWVLYGCYDEAALNYTTSTPLHQNPSVNLDTERPVTTCQYCPGGKAGYGDITEDEIGADISDGYGCPHGYSFYWSDYQHVTDASTALVTDSTFPDASQSNFYLGAGTISNVLDHDITDYSQGHCYCRADLEFLLDIAERSPHQIADAASTDPYGNVIQMSAYGGKQIWDEFGRLTTFSAGGEFCNESLTIDSCRQAYLRLGDQGIADELKNIPLSVANLDHMMHLDLSYQYLTGQIPKEIELLANSPYVEQMHMDFSFNYFNTFDLNQATGHGIALGSYWHGICAIAEHRGEPTESDEWLKLMGNHICPSVNSPQHRTFAYPECLVPPYSAATDSDYYSLQDDNLAWCEWIYDNLGFADIPCYNEYNASAQNITSGPPDYDILPDVCIISGCIEPQAKNYWISATADCGGTVGGSDNSCCQFDRYFHFPWGTDVIIDPTSGGSYGGNLDLFDLVQALHATIYGFHYNARGEVDVTNTPFLEGNSADDPDCLYSGPNNMDGQYLTNYQMTDCEYWFQNDPVPGLPLSEYALGDGIVNHWDGIWLKFSNYIADGTAICGATPDGVPEPCLGDSRMLDFINRIEYEASKLGVNGASFKEYWWSWFPPGGMDISMQGIVWKEDYDLNGDGEITIDDAVMWEELGRPDIANLIITGFEGMPTPESQPDDVELWEQAVSSVSMSYSQKFISEAEAGFSLYPSATSIGVLTRNGQWQCDDGGPAEICYSDIYSCGRAPEWIDECTPCGNGAGMCVPLTLDTAAEGHEKLSRINNLISPYFSEAKSSILYGKDIYTASLSSSNHPYYYSVTDGHPTSSKSDIQFNVSWGHYAGSGSDTKGDTVRGSSEAIYKQYSSLLLDHAKIDNGFMISSGSDAIGQFEDGDRDRWVYVLNFKRKNFGDQLSTGNWTLHLSGSAGEVVHLTDDSKAQTTPSIQSQAGRRYNIVSGSNGQVVSSGDVGRYGLFYPDFGIMVFGEKLSNEINTTTNPAIGEFNNSDDDQNQLMPYTSSDADGNNALRFINCMRNVDLTSNELVTSGSIKLYGESEVTDVIYVCRIAGDSFNFTNNFTIISGSGRVMYSDDTGVLNGFPTHFESSSAFLHEGQPSQIFSGSESTETVTVLENLQNFIHPGVNKTTMHGNTHTFITGIELFDEHGECLATARTSKPIKKAFDREVVIKVKLSF